jgi:hypothetical protein
MARAPRKRFSQAVSVFQDRRLPEPARPAGYAALIEAYDLKVPLPRTLSAIGTKHKTILQDGWRILTPRHEPEATLERTSPLSSAEIVHNMRSSKELGHDAAHPGRSLA